MSMDQTPRHGQFALGGAHLAGFVHHLRLHRDAGLAAVDRLDDGRVALLHHVAPQLAGARDLAVVGVELLVQAHVVLHAQGLGQLGVDPVHRLAQQRDHLGLLRQVGVRHVRDAARLAPVAHRFLVDADHGRQRVAPAAQHRDVLDERAELEQVLDVVGDVALALGGVHHLRQAPEHHEVAVRFHVTRVARVQPAVLQRLARGRLVLEVAAEHAAGADHDLAGVADLHLHARQRPAHGVELDLVGRLHGVVGAALGLAVELAQLEAERAVEDEGVLADGLAAGEGMAQARQPELVLDRGHHQELAERAQQFLRRGGLLAFELAPLGVQRRVHEQVVEEFLQARGVFHPHVHGGEHVVPAARRGQVERGRDLAQVVQHRLLPLGHVDGEAQRDAGADGEGEVADPRHRQVGENRFAEAEGAAAVGIAHARQDVAVAEHHALGLARGARRMDEHRRVIRLREAQQRLAQARLALQPLAPPGLEVRPRDESRRRVARHPARVVVHDVADVGAALAQVERLVDLLLVFGDDEGDLHFAGHVQHFLRRRVRVHRHRVSAEHARAQHAHVQARPVVAEHQHALAAHEAHLLQPGGDRQHGVGHLRPGRLLPDAPVLLAHRDGIGHGLRIGRHEAHQRGLGVEVPGRGFRQLHARPRCKP